MRERFDQPAYIPAAVNDPSDYPRTYRVSKGNRVFYSLLGTLLVIIGLLGTWYFGTGHEMRSVTEALTLAGICLLVALLGGALLLYMTAYKVVLYPDLIEVWGVTGARKLRREEIAGMRTIEANYGSILILAPRRAEKKKLTILRILRTDAAFDRWLAAIPNIDARELAQSETELLANRDIGRTPEERSRRLARARKLATALTILAVPVSVWGYFWPEPYEFAMAALAALPMAAVMLMAVSSNLYQIAGRGNDARASLAVVFMIPGVILALRAIQDIELLEYATALAATAATAAALTSFLVLRDPQLRKHRWEILALLLMSAFYTFGVIVQGNALLDQSEPKTYETKVISKRKTSGRSTTYYLRLAAWGPRPDEKDVSVSRSLYAATAADQHVCIFLRPGALQIPWFVVQSCQTQRGRGIPGNS